MDPLAINISRHPRIINRDQLRDGLAVGTPRPGGTLVTLAQHPEANQAIGEAANALGVRGVNAADYLPPAVRNDAALRSGMATLRNQYRLHVDGIGLLSVDSPLAGQHQQRNLALAIATAVELRTNHGFAISNDAIETGIRVTNWPGRNLVAIAGATSVSA